MSEISKSQKNIIITACFLFALTLIVIPVVPEYSILDHKSTGSLQYIFLSELFDVPDLMSSVHVDYIMQFNVLAVEWLGLVILTAAGALLAKTR